MVINHEKTALEEKSHLFTRSAAIEDIRPPYTLTKHTARSPQSSPQQLLLQNKFITHHPKAGLNPLVDCAAYLFSSIGKLKQLKSHRNLNKLQKELVHEINVFQDMAKAQGYSSEYILVSRYALCATIDDTIINTPWGGQGQWDNYSVLHVFNQEFVRQDRFFLILERIIKDPTLYIDVMEFMYICLSLGYKGNYRSTEFSHYQLEKITHSLYKRIRAHHGDFSKTLSPFPLKNPQSAKPTSHPVSYWFTFFITASIIMLIFVGLGFLLDTLSSQVYQELLHIGKSVVYDTKAI